MRFAGGDDPIELLRSAGGSAQRFLRGTCAERQFVLSFGGVSKRFDAGAVAQFADGYPERTIYFFRRKNTRTGHGGRGNCEDRRPLRQTILVVSCGPMNHLASSTHSEKLH